MGGPVCNSYQVAERFSITSNTPQGNQEQVDFVMKSMDR